MKKFLYIFLFLLCGFVANAQLITENFAFTGTLSSNGWTAHSGAGTNAITSAANVLTYAGYIASGNANAASFTTTGEDVNKAFTAQTAGTIYASTLVNITSANLTGDYFFHLLSGTSIFYSRTFAKKRCVK